MATASHSAIPTPIGVERTEPVTLVRDDDAPAAKTQPGLRTQAVAATLEAVVAGVAHVLAPKPQGEGQPPRVTRQLPAWLAVVLAVLMGTSGAGAAVIVAWLREPDDALKAEVQALKAATTGLQTEVSALRAERVADLATLQKNDAAFGRWAVDMSKDVSEGLVAIDMMLRPMAKKQGIDTDAIAKPSVAEPGPTVQMLGIQGEVEGL